MIVPQAMPIYEYRCDNGHTFEVFQSMSDDPVDRCEVCGAPVQRVFHPSAVHFKGSGFYTTDYARKGDGEGGQRRRVSKPDGDRTRRAAIRRRSPSPRSASGDKATAKKD